MAAILQYPPRDEGNRLAVTICATAKYQYAMRAQARSVHANLRHLRIPILIILVGDEKLKEISKLYHELFGIGTPIGQDVTLARIDDFKDNNGENYKGPAQLLIAQMRTAAFSKARAWDATHCWSLDSDVIPKTSNCFRTLAWLLEIPNNYYEVAISPYPSQGGGDMLTGRGTPENPILQDYPKEERTIPEELQKRIDANAEALAAIKGTNQPPKELVEELSKLNKEISECTPKGNIFELSGKNGWRRRGWLSAAYPALGRGTIVPSDWCGFGNTLMSRRALDEADFLGYDGGGTEDLYIVWHRWHQVGIRIGSALHEPSFHVSRRKNAKGEYDGSYFLSQVRFVTSDDETKGECVGHLRTLQRPFYGHDLGEVFDPTNDGRPVAADKSPPPKS